jgi:hypothetical protein
VEEWKSISKYILLLSRSPALILCPVPAQKKQINLLPRKGFEATAVGRVVGWLLGTFRIILIITEIIVMSAFFSRFFLDAKNSDLNEEIQQKQAVIASFANIESEFRSVQNRLAVFIKLSKENDQNSKILDAIRISLPEKPDELSLSGIRISKAAIDLDGISISEKNVQQLIANLESTDSIQTVVLRDLSSKSNDAYLDFTLSMKAEAERAIAE